MPDEFADNFFFRCSESKTLETADWLEVAEKAKAVLANIRDEDVFVPGATRVALGGKCGENYYEARVERFDGKNWVDIGPADFWS